MHLNLEVLEFVAATAGPVLQTDLKLKMDHHLEAIGGRFACYLILI
jgi:hypothetical protein